MFRFHRSFTVRSGRGPEVRQYLTEIITYLNDAYTQPADGFVEVFGPGYPRAHLMMDFPSLAAFEEFWNQLGRDDDFGAIQGREFDLAIEGSFEQALLHASDTEAER